MLTGRWQVSYKCLETCSCFITPLVSTALNLHKAMTVFLCNFINCRTECSKLFFIKHWLSVLQQTVQDCLKMKFAVTVLSSFLASHLSVSFTLFAPLYLCTWSSYSLCLHPSATHNCSNNTGLSEKYKKQCSFQSAFLYIAIYWLAFSVYLCSDQHTTDTSFVY
jgi:hypothetical protein